MRYIGQGHYGITATHARELADGKLPAAGRERLVRTRAGVLMWLSRTTDNGKQVWTLRDAGGWTLINGVATLGA